MIEAIQSLTLDASPEVSRGIGAVDARLRTFHQHLHNQIHQRAQAASGRRLGIRCSLVPTSPMTVPREVLENAMIEPQCRFSARLRSGERFEAGLPIHVHNRRTILRGVRAYFHHEETSYNHEFFLDGTQNVTFVHRPPSAGSDAESDEVFAGWALGLTTGALRIATTAAEACARPPDAFCVEVQVCFAGGGDVAGRTAHRRLLDYRFDSIATTFPRYSFRPDDGPIDLLNALLADLYGSAGVKHTNPLVSIVPD
jgi:hypothetical protein